MYLVALSHFQEGETRRLEALPRSWQTVASGTSALPFQLDDGTGQCIVKPDGAEVVATESTTWYGNTPWPTAGPGQALSRFEERDYRYIEERIYEHELVYALGGFRSTSAAPENDSQAAAAALLSEWKLDQPALLQRFDSDADGRISLAEWEQARLAARHAVDDRRASRIASRSRCTCWPGPHEDQLFLLAALPAGDLARRYRRRAILAFAGFVIAVFALGWLLQDAFG